jgi:hypothetical protein
MPLLPTKECLLGYPFRECETNILPALNYKFHLLGFPQTSSIPFLSLFFRIQNNDVIESIQHFIMSIPIEALM